SFPVPVSPWINTAESTGATLSTSVINARNFGLDPIKSKVVIAFTFIDAGFLPRFLRSNRAFAAFRSVVSQSSRGRGSQLAQRRFSRTFALREKLTFRIVRRRYSGA